MRFWTNFVQLFACIVGSGLGIGTCGSLIGQLVEQLPYHAMPQVGFCTESRSPHTIC